MMKKKKKITIFKKLFFAIVFGIACVSVLGSWSYDPQTDTITSDNICSPYSSTVKTITKNGITLSMNNGVFTFNGSCTTTINEGISYFMEIPVESITLQSGDYYYTGFINQTKGNFIFEYPNYKFSWNTSLISTKITISNTTNFYDLFHIFISVGDSFNNVVIKPMISTTPISNYEPVGQYVNKEDYEQLESDYTDLENQYLQLTNQFESLQSDYNDLSYNYEQLQSNYSILIDEYDTLLEEYQVLTNQYNSLKSQYDLLYNNVYPMRMIYEHADGYLFNNTNTSLYYLATSINSYLAFDDDLEVNSNVDYQYITPSNFSNIEDYLTNVQNTNQPLYWSIRLQNLTNMPLNISFVNSEAYSVFLYNTYDNTSQSFDVPDSLALSINNQQEFNYNVVIIKVYQKGWTWTSISTNNYNVLYNQGYNEAMSIANDEINRLKNNINLLNNQIRNLEEQIESNLGWRSLFFAMADTPLRTVSNVLGFELFGINLFKAFIGIITALAIIWLIRKIWK